MMKKTGLIFASFILLLSSCTDDRGLENIKQNEIQTENILQNSPEDYMANPAAAYAKPGLAYVKMSEEIANRLNSLAGSEVNIQTLSSVSSSISLASHKTGITHAERLFPDAGEYEARHRKYGLHLWYIVHFNQEKDVIEALNIMSNVKEFEKVEPVYPIQLHGKQTSMAYTENVLATMQGRSADKFFDDPLLPNQWHYNNMGTAPGAVMGADINLFEGWKKEAGKPNVIVAVIDDGVDIEHEDIKENLWINKGEIPDNGKDDDNNGYVDDIHGASFIPDGGVVGNHGTHVAGTVAARNNNGKGVCGVAGGDGTKDSGVRLMTCLAIDSRPKEQRKGSYPETAMVYAADNGAVISQNSWGLPPRIPMPEPIRIAIDYFIDNAGVDKNTGAQRADSPMKGGLVFFAAGNDNEDAVCYPATYEKVVAISAMSTNFVRASYTNRGDWVDIMAPGGDQNKFGANAGVLSCVPKNKYAYYQGTSMACPHASGVAALILSKNGKMGYTNEDLRKAVVSSLLPVDIDVENPSEKGRLGRGYLDAGIAFATDQKKAPEKPKKKELSSDYKSITVSWILPKDEDDVKPMFCYLYISEKVITKENLASLNPLKIRITKETPGNVLKNNFKDLTHSTTYHFAIVAEDRWGNRSEMETFTFATKVNYAPEVTTNVEGAIKILGKKTGILTFNVKDPENQKFTISLEGETSGVSYTFENGVGTIQIRPVLPDGEYSFVIRAVDELGATTEKPVKFIIHRPHPLKLKGNFSNVLVGMNQSTFELQVKSNISFDPEFPISVEAHSIDESVVKVTVTPDGVLKFAPGKKGLTTIKLKISDEANSPLETTFKVRVVENSDAAVHIIYPVPVTTMLNIMLNKSIKDAKIKIVTLTGKVVMETEVKKPGKDEVTAINVANLAPDTYRLIVESSNMARHEQLFVK